MSKINNITIRGAKVHNLQNIDVDIPRNKLVIITGLSGSGKSSLAFDTIYAEGQRRYVESLSSYARQFLQMQDKPDVDLIEGLSPAISIEQKSTSKNPRSTVATVTEIYDYLRLLYARVGEPFCYQCNKKIHGQSASQIINEILKNSDGKKITILSPIIRQKKGEYKKTLQQLQKQGFSRVRIDKQMRYLEEDIELNPKVKHDIEIVVDRLIIKSSDKSRLADAIELSLSKSGGMVTILHHNQDESTTESILSENFACIDCGISYPPLEPRMFSFNAPLGACPTCGGLGSKMQFDELGIIDTNLSIKNGAVKPWSKSEDGYYMQMLGCVAQHADFNLDTPWCKLSKKAKQYILYGTDFNIKFILKGKYSERGHSFTRPFEGIIANLQRRFKETTSDYQRAEIEKYMSKSDCEDCNGKRLRKESCFIRINKCSLPDLVNKSIVEADKFINNLSLSKMQSIIAKPVVKEIASRLKFLASVGLQYLTLSRSAATLSGGEAQRIRLATQIGSALVGVLYVLDEPSIGLHQRDNDKLIATLKHLRDLGNTVLVVEHDEDTIMAADHIIDLGPKAGRHGGKLIASGTARQIMKTKNSLTGQFLSGKLKIDIPKQIRPGNGKKITIKSANGNNLKNIDVEIPLGKLTCITGVSGSGKSSLIIDTLYKALAKQLYKSREVPLAHKKLIGTKHLDKVIDIDQSPIGKTPRSNPATYIGVFDDIRNLFAQTPQAKMRGYKPGRFSFNVKGGRCQSCQGGGLLRIEMNFLPDVYVTCDECSGKRYNHETLEITYKEKNISDILVMTVDDALAFFKNIPSIHRKLQTLQKVGLGYIHLGQSATTLSGGEAQRIKLSKELSKRSTGKTLYILDEPTTGLHFYDIKQLLSVLHSLVDKGNSMLIIEHNLDIIKNADWIIDIGPDGGHKGGNIVFAGTLQDLIKQKHSYTAKYLKKVVER